MNLQECLEYAVNKTGSSKDILDRSFTKQCEFIEDHHTLKALWCTRRAAKSYTGGLALVKAGLENPGSNCLYLGLTRGSAKGIIWKDVLKQIDKKFDLQMSFNGTELTATFPNGSIIYVTGVDADEDEMEKLLGKKYKFIFIDEAQSYSINLRALIYGVLGPACVDQGGTICIAGTSGNITQGLFFDITNKKEPGWKLFTWTAFDNPYVAEQWQLELDRIDRERPLFKETPLYKQWYLNLWDIDAEKLVYKFNHAKNTYIKLPAVRPEGWTYILGVDTGWEDDNAFVLAAFHENDPCLYIIRTFNQRHMTFDQVTLKIHEFMAHPTEPPCKIIIDGANKQGVESMRQRSAIPFEYADKTGKVDFIEMMNADFIQERIKIHFHCNELIQEVMGLVWKTTSDKIDLPKKEHPSLPNHLCDAMLYAWRNGYHYQSEAIRPVLVMGSKAWYEKTMQDQWEKEREALIHQEGLGQGWPSEEGLGWGRDY